MTRTIAFLSATLATTLCVTAQNTLVAPALFQATEAGSTGNIWRAGINRYQCAYDASHFVGQGVPFPIDIHTVEYRLDGGLTGSPTTYPNVEIYLDVSANDFESLSTSFADNRTQAQPRVPEYSGPVQLVAAGGGEPNDYVVTIPLDNPFRYVPENGADLLVEIVLLDPPSPLVGNTMSSAFNITTHGCSAIRSVGSTTAATGSLTAFCPVVRFGYNEGLAVARHDTYGAGCYDRAVSFYESFDINANDLGNTTLTATPNAAGGYDVAAAALGTFDAPTTPGLALDDDVVTGPIALPFTFDYPGGSTTSIFIDSNGRILLNGTDVAQVTATPAALLASPVHVLCPAWQDLHPDGATNVDNVHAEANAGGTEFYITWNNVSCFPNTQGGNSTFQVALIDQGSQDVVEFRYQTLVNDSTTNAGIMMTAFSLGSGAVDPGASDLSAGGISTSADSPALALSASPRPTLGSTCTYTLDNLRANASVSLIRISFYSTIPTPLTAYGLTTPDCYGHIHLGASLGLGNLMFGNPTDSVSFTWPTDVIYTGAEMYCQGLEIAPGENADGVIVSNGLKIKLGQY
ncbi:MAG: hypothetical protein KDE27_19535 [Planctomycetes bacterium]|nr:hypothetical protein [Planctomycetota bacterium]